MGTAPAFPGHTAKKPTPMSSEAKAIDRSKQSPAYEMGRARMAQMVKCLPQLQITWHQINGNVPGS